MVFTGNGYQVLLQLFFYVLQPETDWP